MNQVHIGDIAIRLRPWPTPDPAKCSPYHRFIIGVLVGEEDIIEFAPLGVGPPRGVDWMPLRGTQVPRPLGVEGEQWVDPGIHPHYRARGWFWLREPPGLPWVEGRNGHGQPTWTADLDGKPLIVQPGRLTTHGGKDVAVDVWEIGAKADSVADAQRAAECYARDYLTRRNM